MGEQWLRDFEKAQKLSSQLAKEVGYTGPGEKKKIEAKQAALLRGNLAHLRQDVTRLEHSLMAMSQNIQAHGVTRKELSRRGDLLGRLSEQVERIQEALRTGNRRPAEELDPPWRNREVSDGGSGGSGGTGDGDLLSCFDQEIRSQDDTLDLLHGTLRNLKGVGGEISQEIDLHCRLLGELEEQSDSATSKVKQQQAKLQQLSDQPTMCYLWVYIIFMFIVLMVLLIFF